MRKPLLTLSTRLGLVLLGVALALLGLELAFRLLYPDPTPKLVNQGLQPHDTFGIAFTPTAEGWNTSLRGEYSTYITLNEKGLRGKAYAYQKEPDAFRLLVLGDSFTAALQVDEAQLFTSLLEKQLTQHRPDTIVEVINAGVVGYGTTNELAYYVNEGYKYRPDIVVLMFFTGNDVLDNVNPAHFQLEDGQLTPIEFSYGADFGTPPWAQKGTLFRNIRNYLYTHSRLYSVVIELLTYALVQRSPELTQLLQSAGFVEATRPVINAGNIYSFLRPSEAAWAMTEALLLALDEAVRSHGSQLLVVIIPDETEVNVAKWEKLFAAYPDLFDQTALNNQPTDRLGQMLNRHDIPYLQLQPLLKSAQQHRDEPLYYPYDGHWKPEAHALAAEAIYDYLTQKKNW